MRREGERGEFNHQARPSRIHADAIVAAVGAQPNIELFEGKLEIDDERHGIKVNERLETSAPDVYAAGDIAVYPLRIEGGKPVRQEHVQNGRESGRHAAKCLLYAAGLAESDPGPYDYLPYFYSRVLDFSWKR